MKPSRSLAALLLLGLAALLAFFWFGFSGGSYIGEGVTLYQSVYGGKPTAQGYVYIPFTKTSKAPLVAQVAIDANGDGAIAAYDTPAGMQQEWVVRNAPTDFMAGDANRLTFTIVDPEFALRARSGTVVLTTADESIDAWTEQFASEKDRATFTIAEVLFDRRDDRKQFDKTGELATGMADLGMIPVAHAQGAAAPAPAAPAAPALGPNDYARIDGAPDQDQLWNECAPTAISNSFRWLAKKYGLEDKMPKGDANDLIDEIKGDTAWNDGVAHDNIIAGKSSFITRHDLPLEAHQIGHQNDDDIVEKIYAEIQKGQAVEVWLAFFTASGTPAGAHLVTVVGAGHRNGKRVVAFHDPDTTSADGRPSRDAYEVQFGNYMEGYMPGGQTYIRYAYAQSPITALTDGTWTDPAKTAGVLAPGTSLTPAGEDITMGRSQFGFFSVSVEHPGDHYVGETFPVRAGAFFTGKSRTVEYYTAAGVLRSWTHGAGKPWSLSGVFEGGANVSPATIPDAPPTTSIAQDRFTVEKQFTCVSPGVAMVSYRATLNWPRVGGEVPAEVLAIHHGAEFTSTSDVMRVDSPVFRCIAKEEEKKDEPKTALQPFCPGVEEDPNGMIVDVLKSGNECYPTMQFHQAGADKCDATHWHGNAGMAISLTGRTWTDPSGCGFGRISEVSAGQVKLSPDAAAPFIGETLTR